MSERVKQIAAAMSGRKASQVNDNSLRDAVRGKLVELAQQNGRPLDPAFLSAIVSSVLRSAAQTVIFEAEVLVALEMGAAGELEHEGTNINQTNAAKWVVAYACSGDRSAAQQQLALGSTRDKARASSAVAEAKREDFQRDGLLNAWRLFMERGEWDFFDGYGAAIYEKIGKDAVRALLSPEQIGKAKIAALSAVRRDYPQKYRTAPDVEVVKTDVFKLHAKAQLCRAYFETLRERSLDITYNPVKNERA